MKKGLYFATALLFVACNQTEKTDLESITDTIETKIPESIAEEPIRVKRDSVHPELKPDEPIQMASFNGSWFRVEYPQNFTASPITPTQKYGDYEFVDTDEASFTSPDGTVEFFVYSPQWGGDPIDYLVEKSNEKTASSSEDNTNSDDPFSVSHHWVTYEDKEGKYTRSYHSLMTESTHHVFGVRYTNRKMYERYKAAYLAFKKSLQQFAD
ncbi:MAG: hypothetical protein COA38_11945 [Fluviicola sp.]|nr:MAG: hypothetical protein COA38_11945 [Fluviicola sp.]